MYFQLSCILSYYTKILCKYICILFSFTFKSCHAIPEAYWGKKEKNITEKKMEFTKEKNINLLFIFCF